MLKRKAEFDAKHINKTSSKKDSSKKQKVDSINLKQQHKDLSHYLNKQRTLVLSSRGTSFRDRHLLADLCDLLPHHKKENKLDTKHELSILNELSLLKNCNNVLYLEARKHKDLYLWMSRTPTGPSIKYQIQNIHTMEEVKMTGNHMKYSRPLLLFDSSFDEQEQIDGMRRQAKQPHLALIKEMIIQCLGSPKGHPKVKPFIDHILSFFYLDQRIWMRHYQIVYDQPQNAPITGITKEQAEDAIKDALSSSSPSSSSSTHNPSILLVEVGPRLVLNPIRIFSGSFGGTTLWENSSYISPNVLRAEMKLNKGMQYRLRRESEIKTAKRKEQAKLPEHVIDTVFEQQAEE